MAERASMLTFQSLLDQLIEVEQDVQSVMAGIVSPTAGISWFCASGENDTETGESQHPTRPFRIASITKLYVAAAVLRLSETHQISLLQAVKKYLPDGHIQALQAGGYDAAKIRVLHFLNHTSGLRDHAASDAYLNAVLSAPHRTWTPEEQLAVALRLGEPLFSPGGGFHYSDTAYVLLGQIIENVTGDSLAQSVRQILNLDGLGLTNTYWELFEQPIGDTMPRCRQFIGETDATEFHPSLDLFGGGGLISNLADLATFARALFGGRILRDSHSLTQALIVPRVDREPNSHIHSALGMVLPMGTISGWGHLGFWGCGVVYAPLPDLCITVSINQAHPQREGLLSALINEIGELALDAIEQ